MIPNLNNTFKKDLKALLIFVVSAIFLIASVSVETFPGDAENAAQRAGKTLSSRMEALDEFLSEAMNSDHSQWMDIGTLPEDLVIYRYLDDTLQSWNNQFTVSNDDISRKIVFQRLSNLKDNIVSPLSEVTEDVSYVNYGPKWYLVKAVVEDNCRLIGGIEILNTLDDRSFNGVNPKFRLNDKFTIQPLSYSDGEAVYLGEQPVFKIVYDSATKATPSSNTVLLWLSFLFFVASGFLFLRNKRSWRRLGIVLLGQITGLALLYKHGISVQSDVELFSPTVYANGDFFNSLGAVVIFNLFIGLFCHCFYMMRRGIFRWILSKSTTKRMILQSCIVIAVIVAICLYVFFIFKSIIMNSSITLELYRLNELSIYTAVVYLSLIQVLMVLPLLWSMLLPLCKTEDGKRKRILEFDPLKRKSRLIFSITVALFLVLVSAFLGFEKEQNRVDVWVNRLSMDRDISVEITLRQVENDIANDQVIASLTGIPGADGIILNRITESHLLKVSQGYTLTAFVVAPVNNNNPRVVSFFNDRIRNATPIADGSRFYYTNDNKGQAIYSGMFVYYNQTFGLARLLVSLEPKASWSPRGYANILGYSTSGRVMIPVRYAFAKYVNEVLATYSGTVPYPTVLNDKIKKEIRDDGTGNYISDGYSHTIRTVSDNDVIIISRPIIEKASYFIAVFFVGLFTYLCSRILSVGRRRRMKKQKNYFKSRINGALMISLVITLIGLSGISILFVYRRNDASSNTLMSDRVTSIQALLQERYRYARNFTDLNMPDLSSVLENVGNSTDSDITLYTTSGRAFKSTNSEVFDRMLLGSRIDQHAYDNIVYKNRRYYIHREWFGGHHYHSLYAPVMNQEGKMIAIMCSPYSDESYDFETDAIMHMVTILTIFIILLLLARITVLTVVDKMFKPLSDMRDTMNASEIGNLQYIFYERDDEIQPLVRAYNLMVHDLSNSTKQLAQAERDKAWSEMARQVAHEIKNPLTPMKLQIQRIISLKDRGNPIWMERFDEASKVIIEHIDILTETANEFSTFAKLYSEEYTDIDIDKLLQSEVAMFNSKENIKFSYIGLDGVKIRGPKPQLTRVVVNLITNSVQAIENHQEETGEPAVGQINVSLRNSTKAGYYDIVVEDNGPGVKDEDRSKLFLPKFTTKSSGSGLGLAISRNVVEKCGGEIVYSKSFNLQGACFTIRYPINSKETE